MAPLALYEMTPSISPQRKALINGPVLFDRSALKLLGGRYYAGKTNFIDGSFGSAITPALCGVALVGADFRWPAQRSGKDAAQDILLYSSGLIATKGVTGLFKWAFARPRPMLYFHPEVQNEEGFNNDDARKAFISGHASSAFFATAYLNLRLRQIMRDRLNCRDFRNWNWAPPTALFSWASFVAWSRIHAHQHYLSDVAAGALVGWLIAELMYSLGDDFVTPDSNRQTPLFLQFNFRF